MHLKARVLQLNRSLQKVKYSKVVSWKDLLQKANEKLTVEEESKTKDSKTDGTPLLPSLLLGALVLVWSGNRSLPRSWPYRHPHIYFHSTAPKWAPPRVDETVWFLANQHIVPLNSQVEILVNSRACRRGPEKTDRSQGWVETLRGISSFWISVRSAWSREENKISPCPILSKSRSIATDHFSGRDGYCLPAGGIPHDCS